MLKLVSLLALLTGLAVATPLCPRAFAQSSSINEACAAFTPSGEAIEVSVASGSVTLARGTQAAAMTSYSYPLSGALVDVGALPTVSQPCDLSIDRQSDEAAIGVHYRTRPAAGADAGDGVAVVRFNLANNTWGSYFLAQPPAQSRNGLPRATALAGYWMATRQLATADSAAQAMRFDESNNKVETRDIGRPYTTDITSGVDAAHNRVWQECPSRARLFPHVEACSLHLVRMFGGPGMGPYVASPSRYLQSKVQQWGSADFFAYPSQSTLIFGGTPVNMPALNHCVWKADLDTGLARQFCFDSTEGFQTMSGQAAASADGHSVAFVMEKTDPGGPAEKHLDRSVRVLLVDMDALQQVTVFTPPAESDFAAFAVSHRGGVSHVVVNWGSGWEDHEYPDAVKPAK